MQSPTDSYAKEGASNRKLVIEKLWGKRARMAEETQGLVALFDTTGEIYHAAEKVRDAGYMRWDVFTPFPVHGMDDAMGLKRSKVPIFSFLGGVTGFFSGMALAWYTGEFDYDLIVGGKPFFSPIFPFPVAYELTILLAAFGAFFGMFITNLLPRHHHPVMNFEKWTRITDDKFLIMIESRDEQFDSEKTRAFLERIGGKDISAVED